MEQMEDRDVWASPSRIVFENTQGIFLPVVACGINYRLAEGMPRAA